MNLDLLRKKRGFICDMDGVIYRGKELIPGAQDFVAYMRTHDIPFLFLTNNSEQTPLDLLRKLEGMAKAVNAIEEDFVNLTDAELRALTEEYKQRYADGETLDDLLATDVF